MTNIHTHALVLAILHAGERIATVGKPHARSTDELNKLAINICAQAGVPAKETQ